LSKEEILREEAKEEMMTKLMTQMEVLTKHVMGTSTQKMNVVERYRSRMLSKLIRKRLTMLIITWGVPIQTIKVLTKNLGGNDKEIKVGIERRMKDEETFDK